MRPGQAAPVFRPSASEVVPRDDASMRPGQAAPVFLGAERIRLWASHALQ